MSNNFYSSGGLNDSTGREPFEDSASRNLTGQNQSTGLGHGHHNQGGLGQSTGGQFNLGGGRHSHEGTAFTQGCEECNRSGNNQGHHSSSSGGGLMDKITGGGRHSHEGTSYTQGCQECTRLNNERTGNVLTGGGRHSHEGTVYTEGCDECGRTGNRGTTGHDGKPGLVDKLMGKTGKHSHEGTDYTNGCEECDRTRSSSSHHGTHDDNTKPGLVDKLMGTKTGKHSHEGTSYTRGCEECDRAGNNNVGNSQYNTGSTTGAGFSGLDTAADRSRQPHLTEREGHGVGRTEGGYATGTTGLSSGGNPNLSSGAPTGSERFESGSTGGIDQSSYGHNIGDKDADNHRVGRHGDDFTGGFAATGGAYQNPHATTGLTGRETTTTGVQDQHGDATQHQSIGTKIKNAIGMHKNDDNANREL